MARIGLRDVSPRWIADATSQKRTCLENVHSQNSSRSQNVSVKLVSTSCKSVPFLFHLLLPGTSLDLSPLRAASKFVTKPLRFNSPRILFRQFMESCPVMSTFLRLNLRRGEMDQRFLISLLSQGTKNEICTKKSKAVLFRMRLKPLSRNPGSVLLYC